VYLFTNALLVHLGFLLSKKSPKTLHEASDMALQIKENIFLSRTKNVFSLGSETNNYEDTSGTLNLEKLVSLETSTADIQEEGKKVIDQHKTKRKSLDEVFQEQGIIENVAEEMKPEQDNKKSTCAPPLDEAVHKIFSPAQK
jgi:aspartate aminotransferase-like enzyme